MEGCEVVHVGHPVVEHLGPSERRVRVKVWVGIKFRVGGQLEFRVKVRDCVRDRDGGLRSRVKAVRVMKIRIRGEGVRVLKDRPGLGLG